MANYAYNYLELRDLVQTLAPLYNIIKSFDDVDSWHTAFVSAGYAEQPDPAPIATRVYYEEQGDGTAVLSFAFTTRWTADENFANQLASWFNQVSLYAEELGMFYIIKREWQEGLLVVAKRGVEAYMCDDADGIAWDDGSFSLDERDCSLEEFFNHIVEYGDESAREEIASHEALPITLFACLLVDEEEEVRASAQQVLCFRQAEFVGLLTEQFGLDGLSADLPTEWLIETYKALASD